VGRHVEVREVRTPMLNCVQCKGPAHLATGWVVQQEPLRILCGRCAKDFAKWYKGRQEQFSHPTSEQKKLAKEANVEPEAFTESAMKSIKGD